MRIVAGLCLAWCAWPVWAQISVSDDRGVQINLEQAARRIISLAPHTTELLFAAGAGDRVVGVAAYSDFPEEARRKPLIGDYSRIDLERILTLKPELVVAWESGNARSDIAKLDKMGIKVYVTEPRSLSSIAEHIVNLGRLAGTDAQAIMAAAAFRNELASLRHEYAGRALVTVFYQLWGNPLITVNGAHLISEAIRICGGQNIFSDLAPLSPTVSVESVLVANPELIIAGAEQPPAEMLATWTPWTRLAAMQYGNFFTVPPDYLHRATPRMLRGVRMLCEHLDEARARIARAKDK